MGAAQTMPTIPSSLPLVGADGRVDFTPLTREFFGDFEDVAVINDGWCFVWAWLARLYLPDAVIYSVHTDSKRVDWGRNVIWQPVHAFVRVGARWYDAERPRGERGWRALPATSTFVGRKRNTRTATRHTADDFEALFAPNGSDPWTQQGIAPWPRTVDAIRPIFAGAL
jgi:hypothetical protein